MVDTFLTTHLRNACYATTTIERKNPLSFVSHTGVEVSVIYHAIVETCKMCGVSSLECFRYYSLQGGYVWENSLRENVADDHRY